MESGGILFQVFILATGIQLVFFGMFLISLRPSLSVQGKPGLPVSIIICARNEKENLRVLIPLLLGQHHPDFELIIVNDRSSDGSFDFLKEEAAKDERIRLVHIAETPDRFDHKKYAITLGMKVATHDCVMFTDADCRPVSDKWLSLMTEKYNRQETQIVLGYSSYARTKGLLNQFIRFDTLITGFLYMSFARMGIPYMGVGRNLSYRKSFFMARRGFNGFLRIVGGDDDLFVNKHGRRKNTRVCLDPASVMVSIPKTSFRDFLRQKIRHLSVGKEYRFGKRLMPGLFILSQSVFWIAALILLAFSYSPVWVAGLVIARLILFTITCRVGAGRLGDRVSVLVPLLDFLYVIYYLSTAPVALFTKKVRWKN